MNAELASLKEKMGKAISFFKDELSQFHAGRANPSLVEDIAVECYGNTMPLKQLATITAPEPRVISISPWDKSVMQNIESAIGKSELGLSCSNDGNVIRINIPQLTEERREELIKIIKDKAEQSRISLRNLRREFLESLEKKKTISEISEDDFYRSKDELEKITSECIGQIDNMTDAKEKELKEI